MQKTTCSIELCERESVSRGWCNAHYLRYRRYGSPGGAPRTPSTEERFWSQVEKSNGCWNWMGGIKESGYGQFNADRDGVRRNLKAHRVSFELANGPIAAGFEIDHICHNRRCVNPEHLRVATHKQNNEHLQGAKASSKSGVRGVRWYARTKKWVASVDHHGKSYHIGYFVTIEEAEAAAIAKRIELFTHNDVDRAFYAA